MNNTGQITKVRSEVPYAQIPNSMLRDGRLSMKAKGLLSFLLSLPSDWVIYKTSLTNYFDDGYTAIANSWKELEDAGYILSVKMLNNGQFGGWNHIVYYESQLSLEDQTAFTEAKGKTVFGKPEIGKPEIGKVPSIQRESNTNKEYTNKEKNKKKKEDKPPVFFSEDSFLFTQWFFVKLAPDSVKKTFTEKIRLGWQEVYDQLIAKGYTKDQIKTACTWARQDEFWQQNFRSPKKLTTKNKEQELYIDVFLEKSTVSTPKVVKIEKHVTQEMQKEYDRILKIGFDKCSEEEIVWAYDFQHRDTPALTQMKYPEQLASRGKRITMKAALAQR